MKTYHLDLQSLPCQERRRIFKAEPLLALMKLLFQAANLLHQDLEGEGLPLRTLNKNHHLNKDLDRDCNILQDTKHRIKTHSIGYFT